MHRVYQITDPLEEFDMLFELATQFRNTTPKAMPKWEQYLSFLNEQKRQLRVRFLNSYGKESRGFRLLKQMLSFVDPEIEYLSKQHSDYDRYLNWFLPYQGIADSMFDPVRTGRAYRKTFYRKHLYSVSEYLCPVSDVDHLAILPMGESWESWKKVQPVHLWYHDTDEYTLNLVHGSVITRFNPPNYALVFIDTVALMFMYYKYMTETIIEEPEKTPHAFLWKYVFSKFFDDLQTTWVLNRIIHCANLVDVPETQIELELKKFPLSDRQYGYLGGRYLEAMESLVRALQDVARGSIRVNSLLSSKLLPTGTIIDRIKYTWTHLDVPHKQQYRYMRLLRDRPLLETIVQMYAWRPDHESYRTLRRELLVTLRRMKTNRVWTTIKDSAIRNDTESWILRMEEILDK